MSKAPDFSEMAKEREEQAAELDDLQIYTMMVKNILGNTAMPMDFRVNMLVEALGDVEIIMTAIRFSMDNTIITKELGEEALAQLETMET